MKSVVMWLDPHNMQAVVNNSIETDCLDFFSFNPKI